MEHLTPQHRSFWRSSSDCRRRAVVLALAIGIALGSSHAVFAQVDGFDLWQEISDTQAAGRLPAALKTTAKREIVPQVYRTLVLNKASMGQLLEAAPAESPTRSTDAGSEILLPLPQGGYGRFSVLESPIMEAALAAQFPEIKSYIVQGIDDPTATGRIDTSPKGFRAMVIGAEGTFFIDPYWSNSDDVSICYAKKDFTNEDKLKEWSCGVVGGGSEVAQSARSAKTAARPTGATLRIYRAAIAATGEYTAFHGGTQAGALAAINTTLNRVNTVYERDFCLRMVLVGNNNLIVYTNAGSDPYTNGDPDLMIDQNQTNVDNVIGNANYDIGHVFGTNSGGLAGLGVVCVTGEKALGVTGSEAPVGDPFDVDYVAHEMGHQFNAEHTFNATGNTQRNATTAFEPGSGSTIMSYAGIIAGQNLQEFANDYFHTGSYTEIDAFITNGAGAGAISNIPTGNSPPVIGALTSYTIPARTPFALIASATDADGNTLTYCWEEYDIGAAQDPVTANPRDNGASPIFRSYTGTTNPARLFPSLQYILNNTNVPPPTYSSNSATWATGETIPTTSRTMTYRVSVRDNRAGGGGQNWASTQVTTLSNSGPFRLSSQNTATTLTPGTPFNVTWDVAGTTNAPISAANVRISLSTNGGTNFPITLAESVPNNGTASVTIPAGNTTAAGRLKVEAVGNIFFDVNDANLVVSSSFVAGQITLSDTNAFTENFDSMGALSNAPVPNGLKMSAAGQGTTAGWDTVANVTSVTQQASSGSPATGGRYNWGSSATERAAGFMTSGSYASPNGIMAKIVNDTGSTMTGLNISFDVERYRINTAAASVSFFTSLDGTTWTSAPDGDTGAFATGASSYTFSGGTVVSRSLSLSNLAVANGGAIYLKWNFNTTGGSSQGLGLDNLVLRAVVPSANAPVITSASTASAVGFTSFSYQITATQSPASYGATGLPAGLTIDTATGLISGAPTEQGTFNVTLSASNDSGTGSGPLTLTVTKNPEAPTITSPLTASGELNLSFSYQIAASNSPTSYSASNLPAGLAVDPTTGLISGAPTIAGSRNVTITASNALGTDTQTLVLFIGVAPTINPPTSASAYTNAAVSWQVSATGPVTAYSATGLPAGFTINTSTGLITGTASATPVTSTFQVTATNPLGSDTKTFTLAVLDQAAQNAIPLNVVVNKYANSTPDQIQLLVVGSGTPGSTVDMRGMIIKDFSNSMGADGGGKYAFAENALWSAVPAGSFITLSVGATAVEDFDLADFYVAVNLDNTTYFTSVGGVAMDIATTEMIMIKAAGTGALGVAGGIHCFGSGTAGAQFNAFSGAKLLGTGTTGTNLGAFANNATSALVDYGTSGGPAATGATGNTAVASLNFTTWNNTSNETYVLSLRGSSTTPTILVSPSSITTLTAVTGSAGTGLPFQVSGSNLTGNLTVTAPANFEVSTTSATAGFGPSATIAASGTLNATEVWVRIAATAPAGAIGPADVTVSGGGASLSPSVAVSGTVSGGGTPSITPSPTSLNNLSAFTGQPGTAQSVTVTGQSLPGDIIAAVDSPEYEVANGADGNFGVQVTLPPAGGTILVRIKQGATAGPVEAANLVLRSGPEASRVETLVPVSGTRISGGGGGLVPGLQTFASNLNFTSTGRFVWVLRANTTDGRGTEFSGVNVGGNLGVAAGAAFDIVLNGAASTTDFSADFWKTARSWQIFSVTGNTTGDFALGAITADSGGKAFNAYGSFGLRTDAGGDVYLDWTPAGPAVPSISVNRTSLALPATDQSTAGVAAEFTVTGANLAENVTVASGDAANFAVSTNSSNGFASSLILTNAQGSVPTTPVYVRLTGAAVGSFSNNVSVDSAGAASRSVAVTGTVNDPSAPRLFPTNGTTLSGFATTIPAPSTNQTFTLSGSNLTTNVTITPPPGWQISATNSNNYTSSQVTIATNPAGVVSNTPIHVRLAGSTTPTNYPGSILPLISGTLTNNIFLSGEVRNPAPAVTVSTNGPLIFSALTNQASTPQSFIAGGSNLSTNITVTAPSNFSIAFANNNADFTNTLTLTNSNGTATNREIFVRLNAIFPATNIALTNISLATTGNTNFVSLSGTVTNSPPSLTATPGSLTNLFAVVGSSSNEARSFVLRGSNVFTNVTVSASSGFQVALTNTNTAFGNAVSPVATNGTLSNTIFVRVSPAAATNTNLTGTITNAVSTLTNALVTLQARVSPVPTLGAAPTNLTGFSTVFSVESTNQSFNLSATNLLGPVNLSVTNGYEISTSSNSGFATNLAIALTNASDIASNYTTATWTNGANSGTGFGPWSLPGSAGGAGFNGAYIGAATNTLTNYAPLYSGGVAFSIYAGGSDSAYQDADRTLARPLAVGETLTHSFGIAFDNGNKGFDLYNGTNQVFNFNVNSTGYSWTGGNTSAPTPYPGVREFGAVINFAFTRTTNGFTYAISSPQDASLTRTGSLTNGGIDRLKYYISGAGGGDPGNIYFNNIQVAFAGATITNLPIHVRIGTNAPVTNSLISRVTISSDYATNAYVNLSGTVSSNPVITQSNSLVQFNSVQGFPSDPQEFKVGGINLLTNVLVTPPAGYEVSLDGVAWAAVTNVPEVPKVGVTTPQTNVFIRVAPTAPVGSASGDIVLSSTRASNVLIPVSRVVSGNTGPQLSANPSSLPAFATNLGTASASNNFVLTGSGLSNSVSVTAPSGFEISTNDGATFASNNTLTPRASGFLSNNIAVRLTGSLAGIFSGNVSAASVGAQTAIVSVVGTVYADATAQIAASPLVLSNFATTNGTPSASQSFLGSARNLTNDLVATASTGYEVSTNNTDFFASVNVTPVVSNVAPVAFHARISSNALPTNSLIGAITLSSGSAPPVEVTLNGEVDPARPLSVVLNAPNNNPTIIAPGSSVRLSATVSDTNSSGKQVQIAAFEFRTNNVAIPGVLVTNVASPYTLTYDWTPSPAGLPAEVSAWAVDVDGWEGSSLAVTVRNPDPGEPIVGFTPPIAYPTNSQIEAVAPATNGAFYIGGSFTNFVRTTGSVAVTNAATRVARILADGTVDPDFVTETGPNNTVRTLLYSATNQGLYIGGTFTNVSGASRTALARLAVGQEGVDDGALDEKFAPVLGAVSSPIVNAIVQQYDGRILVGGIFATADNAASANLARFHPDGTRDISFAPPAPNGEVKSIALQPDGKIVIAGSFAKVAGQDRKGIARLNIDGTLDTTFTVGTGPSGGFNGTVWSVAVALDGSIYAGGQFSSFNGRSVYNNMAKLSSTGELQTKFNFAGALAGGINNVVRNVQMRPGGDILVAGQFTQIANSVLFPTPIAAGRVTEFLPDGTLDATFNTGGAGANNSVLNASTLANGNLVLVGAFTQYNGQPSPRMVVLTGASAINSVITSPPFFTVDAGTDFTFTFTSSGTAPYDINAFLLPRGVDTNAGSLTGIPLDAGAFDMDVTATSPGGSPGTPSRFRLQVLPKPVPYDTWKKVWFTETERTNASISGPSVVGPNPSGQPNFTVYALSGGSPKEEGTWILPEAWPEYFEGQQYLSYTVWYYPLAEALYTVQTTGDLQTQPWSANTIIMTNGADFFQVRPPVPMSLTNRQFLRLKITAP